MIVGISGYVGNKLTGIGRVLVNILKNLAAQYPSDSFILFENKDFEEFSIQLREFSNIRIVKINVSKNSAIGNILWHQFSYQKLLKKFNCDVSLIPNFSLLLWHNRPTVVIIHDMIEFNVKDKFSRIRMFYRRFAVPRMARKSDYVITVSESSKRDIVKYCRIPESKIKVILNAVDNCRFKKYDRQEVLCVLKKYGLDGMDYFLFVGTIDFPGKNIKSLVEAFFSLKKKFNIPEKLVVIGKDGFNSKIIHTFVRNSKFCNDVIFTGFVNDEDLPFFYSGAKVFLYLSLYEGFGLPVLEAMSCGTPVICPNTSSFPEIVEGLDVTVNPVNISEIESKLFQMANNDSLRKKIGDGGFLKSLNFSWEKSAVEYMAVFQHLRR